MLAGRSELPADLIAALGAALVDPDPGIRRATWITLQEAWLRWARAGGAGVGATLLRAMAGDRSRLDARHRRPIVVALARWHRMGRPGPGVAPLDPRAIAEHASLEAALVRLREGPETPPWLRDAAFQVGMLSDVLGGEEAGSRWVSGDWADPHLRWQSIEAAVEGRIGIFDGVDPAEIVPAP
ncbi:hypothetical protein [Tautonia plasticadhaerens]|uniref:Uncharacterized protein n=1 Tax=Tautonia plasticadhaerens TaxID=2527974 RepID=A0A518H967_9BACT|nr:hypothetical protein [Tautonia plasticadhaerens]QDV37395.1 hypothetical protein ElP_53340 [Tautonia plasticadhaerens]